jgi:hypothetical protein
MACEYHSVLTMSGKGHKHWHIQKLVSGGMD